MLSSDGLNNKVVLSALGGLVLLACAVYYQISLGLYADWTNDPNYSHGLLVPLISAYFVWQKKEELSSLSIRPANTGLAIILFGLCVLVAGVAAQEYFTQRSSMVFFIGGVVLFLLGWEWLKALLLPIGFLFFMVPLPYIIYDAIAFPLKLFVAKFSVIALKLMNVIVLREGNIIMFPHITLEVADACSGLRSLMSLLCLGVALAVVSQKRKPAMFLLVFLAIPIAVITNMIRVIGTGFLAQYYGAAAAEGFFHEFAGMGVFILAMVMLFASSGVFAEAIQLAADGRGYTQIKSLIKEGRMTSDQLNDVTEEIIGAAYRVGTALGPGFLEKVYERALLHELKKSDFTVEAQCQLKVYYDGVVVGEYFADLYVAESVIVELKSTKKVDESHMAQCLNYLKATGCRVGLIINFGTQRVQIRRVVDQF